MPWCRMRGHSGSHVPFHCVFHMEQLLWVSHSCCGGQKSIVSITGNKHAHVCTHRTRLNGRLQQSDWTAPFGENPYSLLSAIICLSELFTSNMSAEWHTF